MSIVVIETEVLRSLLSEIISQSLVIAKPTETSEEAVLTKKEACQFLNVSQPTLDAHIQKGKLKSYALGGRVLFKKSDLINSLTPTKIRA